MSGRSSKRDVFQQTVFCEREPSLEEPNGERERERESLISILSRSYKSVADCEGNFTKKRSAVCL